MLAFWKSTATSLKFPTYSHSPSPDRNVDLLEIDRLVDLLGVVHLDLVRRIYIYIDIAVEVALFKPLVVC